MDGESWEIHLIQRTPVTPHFGMSIPGRGFIYPESGLGLLCLDHVTVNIMPTHSMLRAMRILKRHEAETP